MYDHAYAASSWTAPSMASLFLARYPSEHQVVALGAAVPDDELTLAEVLQQHGYSTGGFSGNIQIDAAKGFARGFDAFRQIGDDLFKIDAAELDDAALDWLYEIADEGRPFFLYVQYMEPHAYYRFHEGITAARDPSLRATDEELNDQLHRGAAEAGLGSTTPWNFAPAEVRRLEQLYDGEVAHLDQRLSYLFGKLEQVGALENSIVVITADHGEEFGEHGVFFHGISLFEPAIHVPLIVRLPDARSSGRVSRVVDLAGLSPTLLRRLGVEIPRSFSATAFPMEEPPEPVDDGIAFAELIKGQPLEMRLHRQALIAGHEKLMIPYEGDRVYYDLARDPQEAKPLSSPRFAGDLVAALDRVTSGLAPPASRVVTPLDEATRERLRALGYVQ